MQLTVVGVVSYETLDRSCKLLDLGVDVKHSPAGTTHQSITHAMRCYLATTPMLAIVAPLVIDGTAHT